MSGDEAAVAAANERFYEAFESLDLDRMAACWLQTDQACCVHPGWDAMVGWPQVCRSWAAIFANSGYIQFFLTDVRVHVDADVAWVTCAENILSGRTAEAIQDAKVVATNVFVRRGDGWRMALHHGSPVLGG